MKASELSFTYLAFSQRADSLAHSLRSRRGPGENGEFFFSVFFTFLERSRGKNDTAMRLATAPRRQAPAPPPPRRASVTRRRSLSDPNRVKIPPRAFVPR